MGGMTENSPPRGSTPDPVLFGTDPFPAPPGLGPDEEPTYTRQRWPVVTAILILVVVLVGAVGIWVL